MKEKLVKLLENEDFINKILSIKTDEEVRNEFKSNGVELSDEEFENIKKGYGKVMENLEKLDDDTLKELSGGGPFDFCRTNKQIIKNKGTDVIVDNMSRMFGMALDFLEVAGKGLIRWAGSPSRSAGVQQPSYQAAAGNNESTAIAVASVVALSAGAGIVYKNRRAIKRWWDSSK